jgi:hypothetical protein
MATKRRSASFADRAKIPASTVTVHALRLEEFPAVRAIAVPAATPGA